MNKYTGYLIASDLDGTLIDSGQSISENNIAAITEFTKQGGFFAVATGRTEITALPYMKLLPINCPCILYNGAVIYDIKTNTYISTILLDKARLIKPLSKLLENFPDLCMQIYTKGKLFIVSGADIIDPVLLRENTPFELASLEDISDKDWIKVLLRGENQNLQRIQGYIRERVPEGLFHTVLSAPHYLEVFANGVSKGNALEQLLKHVGIQSDKSIAIGDYCNDIEMISTAGLGVATSNGHPKLLEAADIVTVSNDEHAISCLINSLLPSYIKTAVRNVVSDFADGKDDYIKISG